MAQGTIKLKLEPFIQTYVKNWRRYTTIQDALTGEINKIITLDDRLYYFWGNLDGGAPVIVSLTKSNRSIFGWFQYYSHNPKAIYSTDGGATWTVGT